MHVQRGLQYSVCECVCYLANRYRVRYESKANPVLKVGGGGGGGGGEPGNEARSFRLTASTVSIDSSTRDVGVETHRTGAHVVGVGDTLE